MFLQRCRLGQASAAWLTGHIVPLAITSEPCQKVHGRPVRRLWRARGWSSSRSGELALGKATVAPDATAKDDVRCRCRTSEVE